MMLKLLPLTALTLGLSGGVALADHGHAGEHRAAAVEHRSTPQNHAVQQHAAPQNHVVVRDHGGGNVDHRNFNGGYNRGGNNYNRGYSVNHGGSRVIVRNSPSYYRGAAYGVGYRRPIYVSRPVIHQRYYDYYRRPTLIVESYNPLSGYYWVRGQWTWDGAEWIWQPGHYEPDGNYVGPAYDPGY